VHVEHSSDEVRHAEYLAIETFGDFEAMVEALIAALPSSGPILAYNAGFEERVLVDMFSPRNEKCSSGVQVIEFSGIL